MNGRLIVMPARTEILPSRGAILMRSICYGASWGAVTGATLAVVPSVLAAFVVGLLIATPIAAAIGAIFGVACGLTGGLGLIIFRRRVGASRSAIRVVAASGAGLPPATWMIALMISSARDWVPAPAVLTAVTLLLAAALGPAAYFGTPPRRRRSARAGSKSGAKREIVGSRP
jgi:hypothetical protein